jgi:hypothetical protein
MTEGMALMVDNFLRVLVLEVMRAWIWGVMLAGVATYYLLAKRWLRGK